MIMSMNNEHVPVFMQSRDKIFEYYLNKFYVSKIAFFGGIFYIFVLFHILCGVLINRYSDGLRPRKMVSIPVGRKISPFSIASTPALVSPVGKADHSFPSISEAKKVGAIHPLPLYTFMA
jgi:hypothetical protein